MKVAQINTSNLQNNRGCGTFTGRLITKGAWTKDLKDAFFSSKAMNDLASGEKDVIGRLKYKNAPLNDCNHMCGEHLYKLSIEMRSPNPSLKERIKSVLGLSRKIINRNYHSEKSLAEKMQDMSQDFCIHRMKQNLR